MSDELRDEYDFDYSKAKPNRFAKPVPPGGSSILNRKSPNASPTPTK